MNLPRVHQTPAITGAGTRALAAYAAGLRFEDLPSSVVEHVKRIVLNQIAAALSGRSLGPGLEAAKVLAAMGGVEEATAIGGPTLLPAPAAAAVNATLAWAPMNDDTHAASLFHSGHHCVHAALAEAEARGAGGREFIAAVVAASEVGIRIARATSPAHDGVYSSSALGFWSELRGPFCAAVAAARIAELDAERMGHALGIAATSTSGLQELGESSPRSGTVYAWEAGKAVLNGMLAARLAASGMTDGPEPLEGQLGWVRRYTWGHGRLDWLTEGLGSVYETERVQLKTRCNSSMVHPLIDAVHELVRDHRITADAVARVVVDGQRWLAEYLWRTEALTYQDAIFSLPYSLALVILEPGPMTDPQQVLRRLGDPEVRSLMTRMELRVDEAIEFSGEMPGTVTIHTTDGRTLERASEPAVRGTYPERPLDPGELEDKFRRLGRGVLGRDRLEQVIERVAEIDRIERIDTLTALLRPEA